MSTFPLDEPHLAALRWACVHIGPLKDGCTVGVPRELAGLEDARNAFLRALSSRSLSASLTIDLLARAGVDVDGFRHVLQSLVHIWVRPDEPSVILVHIRGEPDIDLGASDVPRLIAALASLTPGDKDGAMRALREVGR